LVRLRETRPERELSVHAVDAGHVWIGDERHGAVSRHEIAEPCERSALDVDTGEGDHDVVGIARGRIGNLGVERQTLVVEPSEPLLVLRERAFRAASPAPRRLASDLDPGREGPAREQFADARVRHRTSTEGDDLGISLDYGGERACFDLAKARLAVASEGVRNRADPTLDLLVEIHELQTEPRRELARARQFARAHEADERDVPV